MKSFFVITITIVGFSIACSAYKSVGSPAASNGSPAVSQNSDQSANTSAQGKTPCTITLERAPDINGIRLGMTPDQVLALFPGSKTDPEVQNYLSRPPSQFGVSELAIKPAKFESKEKFVGINQITFSLLDGRVSTFTVNYGGPEYADVDKFVAKFLVGKSLPAVEQWEAYPGMETQLKTLKCDGFEVRVNAAGSGGNLNYVLLKDLIADQKLKERRKKARESATPQP